MDKGRVSALKGLTLYEETWPSSKVRNVQTDGVAEALLVQGVGARCTGRWGLCYRCGRLLGSPVPEWERGGKCFRCWSLLCCLSALFPVARALPVLCPSYSPLHTKEAKSNYKTTDLKLVPFETVLYHETFQPSLPLVAFGQILYIYIYIFFFFF